jgi:hypothetical protein
VIAPRSDEGDDLLTLIAIGAALAVCASLAHEWLGHGTGCVIDGGTVTLLTFLVFRCDGGGALADGAGPIGAFLAAAACLAALWRLRPGPAVGSLFAYAFGIEVMLWVWGQLIRQAADGSDDWGHVARDLGWPPMWHAAAIVIGVGLYGLTVRLAIALGRPLIQGRPSRVVIPYVSAAMLAVILGGLWHGGRAASALDGLLSFGVAPFGMLLAIRGLVRLPAADRPEPIRGAPALLMVIAAACLAFALTIARGIGRLA